MTIPLAGGGYNSNVCSIQHRSLAFVQWSSTSAAEPVRIHRAIGGRGRGRRHATGQLNRAMTVMLASRFQGYCRALHSEVADELLDIAGPEFGPLIRRLLLDGRQLDRWNARPSSIGADFGRLGFNFWAAVYVSDRRSLGRRIHLERLNVWRNLVAHDREPTTADEARVAAECHPSLGQFRQWRTALCGLAATFDDVVRDELTRRRQSRDTGRP